MLALLTLLNVASEGESARQRGEHEQQQRTGSLVASSTPTNPMHAVASTPTSEIANVLGSWGAVRVPSATAMTKNTRKTPTV